MIKTVVKATEYFWVGSNSAICSRLTGYQPNSAALFSHKLREVIAFHLEHEAHEIFDAAVELDEGYLGCSQR